MANIVKTFLLLLLGCYAVTALELLSTSHPNSTREVGVSSSSIVTGVDTTLTPIAASSTFSQTEGSYLPSGTEGYSLFPWTEETATDLPTEDPSTFSYNSQSTVTEASTPIARATCPESDQIHCKNSDRCTRIRYICDGDNDCGDNSDEDSSLCREWRNTDCERNSAKCTRNGRSDCVTIVHYCELSDPPCEGSVDPRLCKMLTDEKIQDLDSISLSTTPFTTIAPDPTPPSVHYDAVDLVEEFKEKLDFTIRHKDCPQLYTRIGDQCVSVFIIGNLTWMESRAFCQAIGGDLWNIRPNLSNFLTLLQHLNTNQVTKDFWIGGMYKNSTLGWQWVDETPIQIGSPVWAVRHTPLCSTREVTSSVFNITRAANEGVCYHFTQAPSKPLVGHCTSITYEHFYYVSDEDCTTRKSPLCVLPDEHPKQGL